MPDALLRAFLVIGGISAACAWTWPGVFPEADPVAELVRDHTPNVYAAVVAWYDVAPGMAVFLTGQFLISPSRIWFARMGVSLGLRSRLPAWPLSPTATGPGIVDGEVHPPVRAIEGCVATFKKRQERDWSSHPGFDTVVVPAQQEGFESTFLGQNCWYAIRIAGGMLDKIKYIAAYQTNPVSAITHYAPVRLVESSRTERAESTSCFSRRRPNL